MTFVNSDAKIVHDEVTRWGGTCNKNLGNAFLMVWRIGDEKSLSLSDYRRMGGRRNSGSWTESKTPNKPPNNAKPLRPATASKSQDIDLQRIPGELYAFYIRCIFACRLLIVACSTQPILIQLLKIIRAGCVIRQSTRWISKSDC
jgi:hypothetical protein